MTDAAVETPANPDAPRISREEAARIAMRRMRTSEDQVKRGYLRAWRPLSPERPVWWVHFSDPLGGGWSVRVDANTGDVIESRRLPAR